MTNVDQTTYHLHPLNVGELTLGRDHVLGEAYSADDRIPFVCYAFLADGGSGQRVLIDLGPIGLDALNRMFKRYGFFRDLPGNPDQIRQPHGNIFDWLDRLGLRPGDIDHIVLTHLHADHHGYVEGADGGAIEKFPNARIHVSRIGWQKNIDARLNGAWNSYVDYALSDFLLEAGSRGRAVFHDDDEIIPGVEVIHLGGHSPCSQAVRIRTAAGSVIVTSDDVYHYSLLAGGILARLFTTPERLRAANDRLAALAAEGAILLPCHEPLLFEKYQTLGEGWLEGLRSISDSAARDYRSAEKHLAQ
jgi:glyoxylase-like metal-dependent hydrolase (beta-lactamase superfamily II)